MVVCKPGYASSRQSVYNHEGHVRYSKHSLLIHVEPVNVATNTNGVPASGDKQLHRASYASLALFAAWNSRAYNHILFLCVNAKRTRVGVLKWQTSSFGAK